MNMNIHRYHIPLVAKTKNCTDSTISPLYITITTIFTKKKLVPG